MQQIFQTKHTNASGFLECLRFFDLTGQFGSWLRTVMSRSFRSCDGKIPSQVDRSL